MLLVNYGFKSMNVLFDQSASPRLPSALFEANEFGKQTNKSNISPSRGVCDGGTKKGKLN